MDLIFVLMGSSTFLTFALFILLVMLIGRKNKYSKPARKKVSSDLKKIKDQINGE